MAIAEMAARNARTSGARRTISTLTAVVVLGTLATACSEGGQEDRTASLEPETTETTPSTMAPCSQARHLVSFDFFGAITQRDEDFNEWYDDPTDEPELRPGMPELVQTYRSLGYEVLYITTVPTAMQIGDVAIEPAVRGWLDEHGFPGGEGTRVYTWDGVRAAVPTITNLMLEYSSQGGETDAGYTDNEDKANALANGGVPLDRLFTLGPAAGAHGTVPLADADVAAHVTQIKSLPKVCEPG